MSVRFFEETLKRMAEFLPLAVVWLTVSVLFHLTLARYDIVSNSVVAEYFGVESVTAATLNAHVGRITGGWPNGFYCDLGYALVSYWYYVNNTNDAIWFTCVRGDSVKWP